MSNSLRLCQLALISTFALVSELSLALHSIPIDFSFDLVGFLSSLIVWFSTSDNVMEICSFTKESFAPFLSISAQIGSNNVFSNISVLLPLTRIVDVV